MSSASDLSRQVRARTRRRWCIFGALVFLLFAILFLARPLGRVWKRHLTAEHLAKAQTALQTQEWAEVESHITAAAKLGPPNAELLRAMAAYLKGTGGDPNEQLRALQRIKDTGFANAEDLLGLAEVQMLRGDIPAVQAALVGLPETVRSSARAVAVESELMVRLDRTPEAMESLRKQLASQPDDKDLAFRMAVLKIRHGTETEKEEARNELWHEATSETPRSAACIHLLLQWERLTIFQVEELASRAAALKSDARVSLVYLAAQRSHELRPLGKHSSLDELSQDAIKKPLTEQLALLQFFANCGESLRLLEWVEKHGDTLKQQKAAEVLNLELEALAQSEQWTAVRQALTSPTARKLDAVTLSLWQACAASSLDGSESAVADHLYAALRATHKAGNQAMAVKVAETAERLAMHRVAADAYEQLAAAATLPGERLAFLESAMEARHSMGETKVVSSLAQQIANLTPGHSRNEFRAMYLALLNGDNVEPLAARLGTAEHDTADKAGDQQKHLLWCMVYERRKQRDVLNKELQTLDTTLAWPPGPRATMAGMLADAGETGKAKALAQGVPRALLLPEEVARLDRVK